MELRRINMNALLQSHHNESDSEGCPVDVLFQLKSVSQIPWCIGGDVNEIKAMCERKGCRSLERSMYSLEGEERRFIVIAGFCWLMHSACSLDGLEQNTDSYMSNGRVRQVSHLHHCICKVREERCGVGAISIDLSIGGASIEEFLIRVEKALLALQILEVRVIERGWTGDVERDEVVSAASARTFRLNGNRELRIYVGFVVNSTSEDLAL
ncbi:hypothetical protein RHGRI_015625 [Rhododendron griersonianum]|uniref:Uncharacterized protein n=1 Tax=Rhododendron griersonianum TaxID=479676 RepID=A0AAV6KEH7_9ERIC|nr:hypothetical protein RHGRI_015625 [Rhododendron griersonianum]